LLNYWNKIFDNYWVICWVITRFKKTKKKVKRNLDVKKLREYKKLLILTLREESKLYN